MKCNNFELDFSEDLCFSEYKEDAFKALDFILNKNGLGNKFLGWVTHPEVFDREEYDRMKQLSEKVKKSEVLVVIGVGGSFLGSKAVIKALKPYFKQEGLKIYNQSKWTNSLVVETDDTMKVVALKALPFVKSIRKVWIGTNEPKKTNPKERFKGLTYRQDTLSSFYGQGQAQAEMLNAQRLLSRSRNDDCRH